METKQSQSDKTLHYDKEALINGIKTAKEDIRNRRSEFYINLVAGENMDEDSFIKAFWESRRTLSVLMHFTIADALDENCFKYILDRYKSVTSIEHHMGFINITMFFGHMMVSIPTNYSEMQISEL